jgi:50S ribosomal protein L16 3-hydroxylase
VASERTRRFADVPDVPLRLIADFVPQDEYLLEPGDLLYLPPGWGHEGVALEQSWTYSIGFRAPRRAELAVAFLDYLQERGFSEEAYRDPGLRTTRRPARIDSRMLRFAQSTMRAIRWSHKDVQACLGCFLTTPKPHVVFRRPRRRRSLGPFRCRLAARHGLPRSEDSIAVLRERFLLERRGDHSRKDAAGCARATRRSPATRRLGACPSRARRSTLRLVRGRLPRLGAPS